METQDERYDKLRKACWDKSFHCFAFGYIFDKKAQRFSFYLNILKVFGIAVPSAIGATALGYGINSSILKLMIVVAISASTAFLTPVGTTTNAMVMTSGGYKFIDYVKVGAPLLLLFLITTLILVPLIWPF